MTTAASKCFTTPGNLLNRYPIILNLIDSVSRATAPLRPITNERELFEATSPYSQASIGRSLWQLINTLLPMTALLWLMHYSLQWNYGITLAIGFLTSLFMVRLFIIQHDCGHGSFLPSREWNDRVGYFCSVLTMVPYFYWKRQHNLHHASNGNLDRRGHGDMDIYTVKEYLALNKSERFYYRMYRNPIVFMTLGPLALFFKINRMCSDPAQYSKRDKRNIWLTNATILATFTLFGLWIGFIPLLKIAAPVLLIAAGLGIWLFYIQHQFEHTYWKPGGEWNFTAAAMQGSSFYRLPKILQWFTGSIGFHHIHHLKPNIPNYELERCYVENPQFHEVYELNLRSSLKTAFLSVWDPEQQRLISFRELRKLYA